jgi:hypothetical protein
MRSHTRRATAALITLACAIALSGCVVIGSESTSQPAVIGSLVIRTDACFSNDFSFIGGPNGGCPDGNAGPVLNPNFQVLVAFRVPNGITLPATLTPSSGQPMTLTADAGYTAELATKAPPPAGEKWVGYLSNPITLSTGNFVLDTPIALARGADGTPFQGPLHYRVVTGYRDVPPTNPVACGSDVTQRNGSGPSTICVDSTSSSDLPNDHLAPTRDLGVLYTPAGAGSNQAAQGTSTAAVPFALKFAGTATPGATFKLAATSTIPGARAVASFSDYAPPTDSTTPVGVGLGVPAATPVGTYAVTLTASLPNGETRTQTVPVKIVSGAPVNTGGVSIVEPPRALRRPSIAGVVAVGRTVVCTYGDWNYAPTRFTRVWTRNGRTIHGATHQHYRVQAADAGKKLGCTVTAYNASGTGTASATPLVPPRSKAAKTPRRGRR